MAAGKLYTFPENFRSYRAEIAAQYAGVKVEVVSEPPAFQFGVTNKSAEFLAKFPLGKVPAFEGNDGTCIFEANAIAKYLGNSLQGSDKTQQALVEQWINFADNELVPAVCTVVFPSLGLQQLNKQNVTKAKEDLKVLLQVLDDYLQTRTFLVGERVSQADITVCTSLLQAFQHCLDAEFRKPFVNVLRWFTTLVNQPQFKAVIPAFTFCESATLFDAAKYNKLFPKQEGGGKKDGGKQGGGKKGGEGKKKEPKAKSVENEVEQEPEPEPEAAAEPSEPPFCMDTWKKMYRNSDIKVSIPYLWENFNPEEYSVFRCDYAYLEILPKEAFMCNNLINGMFQRLDQIRKVAFGLISCFEVDDAVKFRIQGIFIWKHTGNIFDGRTDFAGDHESYTWVKLDPTKEADRKFAEEHLACEGHFDGKKLLETKMFV